MAAETFVVPPTLLKLPENDWTRRGSVQTNEELSSSHHLLHSRAHSITRNEEYLRILQSRRTSTLATLVEDDPRFAPTKSRISDPDIDIFPLVPIAYHRKASISFAPPRGWGSDPDNDVDPLAPIAYPRKASVSFAPPRSWGSDPDNDVNPFAPIAYHRKASISFAPPRARGSDSDSDIDPLVSIASPRKASISFAPPRSWGSDPNNDVDPLAPIAYPRKASVSFAPPRARGSDSDSDIDPLVSIASPRKASISFAPPRGWGSDPNNDVDPLTPIAYPRKASVSFAPPRARGSDSDSDIDPLVSIASPRKASISFAPPRGWGSDHDNDVDPLAPIAYPRKASISFAPPRARGSDSDSDIDPLVSIASPRKASISYAKLPRTHGTRIPIEGKPLSPIPSWTTVNYGPISENENTLFATLGSYKFGEKCGNIAEDDFGTPPDSLRKNSESEHDLRYRKMSSFRLPRHNVPKFSISGGISDIRRGTMNAIRRVSYAPGPRGRRGTLHVLADKAKLRQEELRRSELVMCLFEYGIYAFLLVSVYFLVIGKPLWKGLYMEIHWMVNRNFKAGSGIFLGMAILYAYVPLLAFFEPSPSDITAVDLGANARSSSLRTALLIPCYKSAEIIPQTIEAALKIFPKEDIFIIANGNSETPLDNTEEVCRKYGVSHTWCPIGSKIVAQFVGCYVVKDFPNVLLIDDDCALPPNFPVVSSRLTDRIKCIGYTIKSVGPPAADMSGPTKGTYCQQAQDLEYKISGLQRQMAGKLGSATFPHGAISIWDREFLLKTFHAHPGFSVSEDWFFGHAARQLGSRITMTSSVFVETETPASLFGVTNKLRRKAGGSRGGFGEMTVYSQRFKRWNFFFVTSTYYNMYYILFSWKLGFWEIGAKLFVFQELYETLLYLLTPFILPASLQTNPIYSAKTLGITFAIYLLNAIIVNYVHLRRKNESVSMLCIAYYMPYKAILTAVNVTSCYWSIWQYAKYFAKRHPKVVEDDKVIEVVLQLDDKPYILGDLSPELETSTRNLMRKQSVAFGGRRLTMAVI